MKDRKGKIDELINYDSLAEAEKITNKSYKEDDTTGWIGLALMQEKAVELNKIMDETGDTKFSETEEGYLKKVESFGFKSILVLPFINERNKIEERFHILFHYDYSILLAFDTSSCEDDGSFARAGKDVPPPSVNGGNFYYNWCYGGDVDTYRITQNGSNIRHGEHNPDYYTNYFDENLSPVLIPKAELETNEDFQKVIKEQKLMLIYAGHHDCREAVKHNISKFLENGTFLKTWKERPFLWLLHHADTKDKGFDHEKINQERIAMLPQDVQDAIKGEKN